MREMLGKVVDFLCGAIIVLAIFIVGWMFGVMSWYSHLESFWIGSIGFFIIIGAIFGGFYLFYRVYLLGQSIFPFRKKRVFFI